jgi:two-component system, sensor histidine kinase and response regulator
MNATYMEPGYLRGLLDAATSVALIAVDSSGLTTIFNSGAERMLRYRSDEVVGKLTPETWHLAGEVEERKQERSRQLKRPVEFRELVLRFDDNCLPEATEWTMVRGDGTRFAASLTVNPMWDKTGTAVGFLGVIQDISDQLEQAQRLEKARRAAESASRAKSDFLAAMSHEIRTPMNGILGMAGLLLKSELTRRQKGRLETLRDSAEALLGVLNDILDFSKLEASKLELEIADFDLRRVVEDVSDLLAVKAQEKQLEVLCFIEPDVPTRLQGDSNRLRQVLVNLVGNAVKFTSEGSVSLRVSRHPGLDGLLLFEIVDTGPGIPAARQHLLFQPFSQADSSTARRYGGTGLGLSIVAGLVKMLGGKVGFRSEEGLGATFWFTAAMQAQPEVKRPAALSLTGKRVLVVDSSAGSRLLIGRYLSLWNCTAEECSGAAEATEKLRRPNTRYDAVLIDIHLPQISGGELARRLHADPALRTTPLIAMTHLPDAHDTDYWQQRHFVRRVTKPLRQGDLGAALAWTMGYGRPTAGVLPHEPPPPERRARRVGRRLLLVEDNAVNREVALGILEYLGYSADVAFDGQEALTLLKQTCYAAVLTDCNLPELDGYDLTRLIRDPKSEVADHNVPIIAMTAHALAGDREKCLNSGMDDYITKPVDAQLLERLLDQYTGTSREQPAPASPGRETANHHHSFDRAELVERLMGNEDLARRVATRFLEDMPAQIAALARAVDSGHTGASANLEDIRNLAHNIKGAAANISGAPLSLAARSMEKAIEQEDMEAARCCLSKLTCEFENTRGAIALFLDTPG